MENACATHGLYRSSEKPQLALDFYERSTVPESWDSSTSDFRLLVLLVSVVCYLSDSIIPCCFIFVHDQENSVVVY